MARMKPNVDVRGEVRCASWALLDSNVQLFEYGDANLAGLRIQVISVYIYIKTVPDQKPHEKKRNIFQRYPVVNVISGSLMDFIPRA